MQRAVHATSKASLLAATILALAIASSLASCGGQGKGLAAGQGAASRGQARSAEYGTKTIVVTYSILGSLVKELAGGAFEVRVLIPNGLDVHDWEASARDVEALMKADLVVVNGLGLEGGVARSLEAARKAGRRIFTATDHVSIRHVAAGEGIPSGDADQAEGAADPHIWTDPVAMKAVMDALAAELVADFGVNLTARATAIGDSLLALDAEIAAMTAALPEGRRSIVTGHESLGYFARRYGFHLVGALLPSLSTEAESSAAWLSSLKRLMEGAGVRVIFTEVGTPRRVVDALAKETGARAIPLATHLLPADGSYASFERDLAMTIVKGLQ